jgi:hypothetical protein
MVLKKILWFTKKSVEIIDEILGNAVPSSILAGNRRKRISKGNRKIPIPGFTTVIFFSN